MRKTKHFKDKTIQKKFCEFSRIDCDRADKMNFDEKKEKNIN